MTVNPMMEFYTSKMVIAKKLHICEMCGDKISIGERYSYESGKYDGHFFERKLHLECSNIIEKF